ncbi:MAG: 50S ribosomal protein L11 methyltransferase [Pseudomonadota bacterium]
MTWLQLRLDTSPQQVPELEAALLTTGAVAVTFQDDGNEPVLEPKRGATPLWQQTRLTGLYPANTDMSRVIAQLPTHLLTDGGYRVEILEDKDWEREWMQHYQPMRFGERLWVYPSWMDPPDHDAVTLMLDPGLAFGTGTHPTTALCLEQLSTLVLQGANVVDYGCGSGILAAAALKLGAAYTLAVDNDPQALVATRDNALRNGIDDDRLLTVLPGAQALGDWTDRADVLVANILAGPLLSLTETLCSLVRPGATVLLSGLLSEQADALITHYSTVIDLRVVDERENWVCLKGLARTNGNGVDASGL